MAGPLTITTSQSGQTLTWTLGTIPAGQQAVITLYARVANNTQANAGTSVTNTASYTYTDIPAGSVTSGTSGPLTIVEPSVTVDQDRGQCDSARGGSQGRRHPALYRDPDGGLGRQLLQRL